MTDQQNAKAPKKPRNWLRVAFIASFAVNLLIVAAFAGAFLKHQGPKGRHLDRVSMGLGAYILALPEPAQTDVMALVGKGSKDRKAFRKSMRKHRDMLEQSLQETPFSPEAVRAAMTASQGAVLSKTQSLHEAYLAAVIAMSDAERAAHFERAKEIQAERHKTKRKRRE